MLGKLSCANRWLALPGESSVFVVYKSVWCALLVIVSLVNPIAVYVGVARDDALLMTMGAVFTPIMTGLLACLLCTRRLTLTFVVVTTFACIINIGWFDLAQLALGRRGWNLYIVLFDLLITGRWPSWLVHGSVAVGCVWVLLCELELAFRYGLLDLPGSAPYTDRDPRECSRPPCATESWQFPVAGTVQTWLVILAHFASTRGHSESSHAQAVRQDAAVAALQQIAAALAEFNLDAAEAALHGEGLSEELRAPFHVLLCNLRAYRPYLPHSLLPHDDEEDTDDEDSTAGGKGGGGSSDGGGAGGGSSGNAAGRRLSRFTAVVNMTQRWKRASLGDKALAALSSTDAPASMESSTLGTPQQGDTPVMTPPLTTLQGTFRRATSRGSAVSLASSASLRSREGTPVVRRVSILSARGAAAAGDAHTTSLPSPKDKMLALINHASGSDLRKQALSLTNERVSLLVVSMRYVLDADAGKSEYEQYIMAHSERLSAILGHVKAAKGRLDFFQGDKVYASFNAFRRNTNHSQSAMNVAVALTQLEGGCVCGVTSGTAAVGTLGTRALMSPSILGDLRLVSEQVQVAAEVLGLRAVCTGMTAMNVSFKVPLRILLHACEYGGLRSGALHPLGRVLYTVEHYVAPADKDGVGEQPALAVPPTLSACDEWMYCMENEPGAKWEAYNDVGRVYHKRGAAGAMELIAKRHDVTPHTQQLFAEAVAGAKRVVFTPQVSSVAPPAGERSGLATPLQTSHAASPTVTFLATEESETTVSDAPAPHQQPPTPQPPTQPSPTSLPADKSDAL